MGLFTKKEVKQSTQPHKVSAVVDHTIPESSKKSSHCLKNSSGVFGIMSRGMNYIASMKKKTASKSVSSLAIHEHRPESTKSYKTDSSCSSSQTNSPVRIKIVIPKTPYGFGFTLKGTELVRVNRVKDGGSAHASGLRRGDVICAINGQDVRHEKSTTIARIVRRSVTQVDLDIYRARSEIPFSSQSCPSFHNKIVNATSSCHKRPLPAIPEQTFDRETNATKTLMSSLKWHRNNSYESHLSPQANVVNAQASPNWHPDISHIPYEYSCEFADIYEEIGGISLHKKIVNATSSYHKRPLPAIPEQSIGRESNAMKTTMSSLKWHRDISYTSYMSTTENSQASSNWHPDISHIPNEYPCEFADIYEEIGGIPNDWSDSGAESSREMSESSMASYDPNTSWNSERIHHATIETNESDCNTTLDWSNFNMNAAFHDQSCRSDKLPTEEELDCLNDLMSTEAEFVHQMHGNVNAYTRPLRHHILSAYQYDILFQNIEQLVKLSERIVHRIAETEVDLGVEEIYGEQISEMRDAYLAYLSGLPAALCMCAQLNKDAEFEKFLQFVREHHGIMPIETFIEMPAKHFLQLLTTIKRLHASHGRAAQENIMSYMVDTIHKSIESEKRCSTTLDSGYGNSSHEVSQIMTFYNDDAHLYENIHAVNH